MSPRPTLVCFAGDSWDGNPHSRHHLMRFLSHSWEVVFVEGLLMRSPALGDPAELGRVVRKLRGPWRARLVTPHLHVLRALPVPPVGVLGRGIQLAVLARQIERTVARLSLGRPAVTWFSIPTAEPMRGGFGEKGSIFYYQDRYAAFSHVAADYIEQCSARLARDCGLSVASSDILANDLRAWGATPVVLPHGVDLEHFEAGGAAPTQLEGLERPLIGYVGLVDDYLDFNHLLAVADRLSSGTLVLVGAVNTDVSRLRHPRIELIARQPYASMPDFMNAFACCLIPFTLNRLTAGVNPIKLREYLAAGRPVVSTALPEVLKYRDVVSVCEGPAAFADAVMASLDESQNTPEARSKRKKRVAEEGWGPIAARLDTLLRESFELPL